ncbi:hypothetical protein V8F06_004788 [Rhypophila decipiens]
MSSNSEDATMWAWVRERAEHIWPRGADPTGDSCAIFIPASKAKIEDVVAQFHRSAAWSNKVLIGYDLLDEWIVIEVFGLKPEDVP